MRLATVMKALGWERTSNKITIGDRQVRGFFRWIKPGNEGEDTLLTEALDEI